MVVLVFFVDWISPTNVHVDLAYQAPVVFAALKGTRRLTMLAVVLSVVGIALGWLMDLAQANFVFSDVRIENRLFSLITLLIVGSLSFLNQRNAEILAERESARSFRRENALASAADRVMSALARGTIVQAVIAEAPVMLGSAAAVWCAAERGGTSWVALDGASEAIALQVAEPTQFEALVERLIAADSLQVIGAAESIDRLVGGRLGSKDALAIPIRSDSKILGVVLATIQTSPIDERKLVLAGNFARFAGTAMQQAHFATRVANRIAASGDKPRTMTAG